MSICKLCLKNEADKKNSPALRSIRKFQTEDAIRSFVQ